ncbi:MAG: hypothetical protein HKN47_17845 [Pirellulaceae bacterium]|nr:hypothetical protein [Pirellulaceae bacterium]
MDTDKLKEFMISHVEKVVLAVVIGVSGFMIWSGLQKEDITKIHQPDSLVNEANQVKAAVDEDHNETILKTRRSNFDITEQIAKRRAPVDPGGYGIPKTWVPTPPSSGVKRQDPTIAAPRALRVEGVLCSMAYRSNTGEYALADLEPAEPVEKVEKKEIKPKKSRRASREMDMMEMMDQGGGDEYGMEMDMGMGMEMEMGEGTTSSGPTRKMDREHDFGMRPAPTKNLKTGKEQPPVPGVGWFIAGTAVVPYKEIYESYRMALSTADLYDPARRDRPMFRGYELQRADVTDKPADQLDDSDWIKRDGRMDVRADAVLIWSGFAPELVSSEYRVDSYLTMWIPPVLLDDYSSFALHPLIPMKTPAQLAAEEYERQQAEINPELSVDDIEFLDPDDSMGAGGGGYGGGDDYGDMGMDMMDEMGDDYGSGGGGGGYGRTVAIEENPVDYKLIRFYDFAIDPRKDDDAPKPGRKYVYRVRISVNDPNFPQNPALQPKGQSLARDVYDRYLKLAQQAEATKKRSYQRWSEWSQPSAPVSLPGREKYFVGPVTAPPTKPAKVGPRIVDYQAEPPKAKMVLSQFDLELRTFVPMLLDVTEGTVLSAKAEKTDVVDPITLEVKKLESPEIRSASTVIDIDGGGPMSIQTGDDMNAPGLMLLFDQNGGLRVHDETGDQELYRIKSFADERGE